MEYSIAERVEEICKEKNIKISDMCKKAKINPKFFDDLKSGKRNFITFEDTLKIAYGLDVTLEYLFDGAMDTSVLPYEILKILKTNAPDISVSEAKRILWEAARILENTTTIC